MRAPAASLFVPDADAADSGRLEAVRELLDKASEPLTAAKIATGMKASHGRVTAKQCAAWADALVAVSRACPFVEGKTRRYWTRGHDAYARNLILAALAKGKPKSAADLDKILAKKTPQLPRADRDALVDELVREGTLHRWPPTGRGAMRLAIQPPDPRVYLQTAARAFRKAFAAAAAKLEAVGVPRGRVIAAALEELALGPPVASSVAPNRLPTDAVAAPAVAPDFATGDFAARFDAEFARLDRQRGAHNFVSLVDLRQALPQCGRAAFDEGLDALRRAGRYGLSAAESLHGLRSDEIEAGIREAGALLLFVSRKRP